MTIGRPVALTVLMLSTLAVYATAHDRQPPKPAIEAAQTWLAMVDSGLYDRSWDTAAGYFRQAVSRAQWQTTLSGARLPLGKLASRGFEAAETTTSIPGAPDGQYVIITYTTAFTNKSSAVETITVMWEEDNTWAVAGYYIR